MKQTSGTIWNQSLAPQSWGKCVTSFPSRMTQGTFVCHHDRTEAVLCPAKNGVVRGTNWTIQPLNDAWDVTNWDGVCGTPWQMAALDLKLTKKVTSGKGGAGLPLARIVVERIPEVEP